MGEIFNVIMHILNNFLLSWCGKDVLPNLKYYNEVAHLESSHWKYKKIPGCHWTGKFLHGIHSVEEGWLVLVIVSSGMLNWNWEDKNSQVRKPM